MDKFKEMFDFFLDPPTPTNTVTQFNGFFISINNKLDELFANAPMFGADSSTETALVVEGEDENLYFILNGDFDAEMCAAASEGGLEQAFAFYHSMKDQCGSKWSADANKEVLYADIIKHLSGEGE